MTPENAPARLPRERTVLIVDADAEARRQLRGALDRFAGRTVEAESPESARTASAASRVDVLFVELGPTVDAVLGFIAALRARNPLLRCVLSAHDVDADTIIRAMRHGVTDLLLKPYCPDEMRAVIERQFAPPLAGETGVQGAIAENGPEGLLGASPAFLRCIETARRAAIAGSTVLITGESGTGKEGIARLIHRESPRSAGPFIPVNCGAIPENLIEAELFGYARGAFTGALSARPGKFTLAHGGTLFLDEIGEMPLTMQVRLLRVLQERVVEPLGGGGPVRADFRLVAATHRDLREAVRLGHFREDLWFRLHVVPVTLPPLRERAGDAVLLARHYLDRFNALYGTTYVLDAAHEERLSSHPWPGNVRELINVIERAVVLSDHGRLRLEPDAGSSAARAGVSTPQPGSDSVRERLRAVERDAILTVLDACRWNKTQAAERLGISRRGLLYKVREYGIQ